MHQLVRNFGDMLTWQTGVLLPAWIDGAFTADLPGPTGFARGLTSGLDAVTAGLTLHWSSGDTEGAVNRIKKIKRKLYGRANGACGSCERNRAAWPPPPPTKAFARAAVPMMRWHGDRPR
ncbi:hypothetical protein GCM10010121_060580 [Streptomyces brasiliensis]|uniref:Transposase IS204/IS1001/IS1096/IS1165 DDE domain-containing protein n=1 Tax=Streptomyces brasiliensis TaxID=1954 RepID=A0A917NYM1_9ACTN|nr:hypothetical protein GCM10010121_060580 [Streptomyces brasiliensis]